MASFAESIPALADEPLQLVTPRRPQRGQLYWLLVALQTGIGSSGIKAAYGIALLYQSRLHGAGDIIQGRAQTTTPSSTGMSHRNGWTGGCCQPQFPVCQKLCRAFQHMLHARTSQAAMGSIRRLLTLG